VRDILRQRRQRFDVAAFVEMLVRLNKNAGANEYANVRIGPLE
jgi:hypothetical protein